MLIKRLRWILRDRRRLRRSSDVLAHWNSIVDQRSNIGRGVRLWSGVNVTSSTLGDYSYSAWGTRIADTDIGKFCSIGPECLIGGLGRHPTRWISTHPRFFSASFRAWEGLGSRLEWSERARTTIGHDVWIGARAIILDGVSIGNGAIVGAGAVVVKDVASFSIVGGVPARHIGYRFDDATRSIIERIDWYAAGRSLSDAIAMGALAPDDWPAIRRHLEQCEVNHGDQAFY